MKVAKVMKILLALLLVAAVTMTGIMMYIRKNRDRVIVDGPGMINTRESGLLQVNYSCGGGMDGGYTRYSITYQQDGALFEYEHCPENGAETVTANKTVSLEYFDRMRTICRETGCLLHIKNGTPSELELLDAPVTTITFVLSDKEYITYHGDYIYADSCTGLESSIVNLFETIRSEAQDAQ